MLDEAWQQSQDALSEIRTLSRGSRRRSWPSRDCRPRSRRWRPGLGSDHGRRGAAAAPDAAQNAAYFVVAEALTNLEKHSQASRRQVEVHRVGALAVVNVTDNGVGGASLASGHGLAGLADRLAGVDGDLDRLVAGRRSDPADRHPASWFDPAHDILAERAGGGRRRLGAAAGGPVRLLTEAGQVVAAVGDAPSLLEAAAEHRPTSRWSTYGCRRP